MALDDSPANLITVQTVYDLASEIGEHFKKLIEQHGQESDQKLISSVVRALEYLEDAVLQREDYILLVDKLHKQLEEHQREQQERNQKQQKYLSEIDQTWENQEESWRNENIKLSQYVKFLKNENKRLASSVNDKISHSLSDLNNDEDEEKLRQSCHASEEKLKKRNSLLCKELELKKEEIDTLKTQNDTLMEKNQNLRNLIATIRNNSMKSYNDIIQENDKPLEEDKTLLENKIRALEEEVEMYKMRLKLDETQLEPVNDRNNNSQSLLEQMKNDTEEEEEENIKMEDLPVQGPLPKEPDFNRERKSRIWSFFPRLTRALIK